MVRVEELLGSIHLNSYLSSALAAIEVGISRHCPWLEVLTPPLHRQLTATAPRHLRSIVLQKLSSVDFWCFVVQAGPGLRADASGSLRY